VNDDLDRATGELVELAATIGGANPLKENE
jgi:hypothetical protein